MAEEQWARVENTHEAIVTKGQFDMVQQLLKEDTRAGKLTQAVSPFCGKIFCGSCGAPMVRKTVSWKGKRYVYYVCGANKADASVCSKNSFREDVLEQAVLATIQRHIESVLDMDKALSKLESQSWERAEIQSIEATMERQRAEMEKNQQLSLSLYEDLQEGILTREEFSSLKQEFLHRVEEAKEVIRRLENNRAEIQQGLSSHQSWLSQFRQFAGVTTISRPLVVNLVERVRLFPSGDMEVVFRQQDQFVHILEFLKSQKGKRQKQPLPFPSREVG